jgi:hypothetical protein
MLYLTNYNNMRPVVLLPLGALTAFLGKSAIVMSTKS